PALLSTALRPGSADFAVAAGARGSLVGVAHWFALRWDRPPGASPPPVRCLGDCSLVSSLAPFPEHRTAASPAVNSDSGRPFPLNLRLRRPCRPPCRPPCPTATATDAVAQWRKWSSRSCP